MLLRATFLAALLAAAAQAEPPKETWELLHELKSKDTWIDALWAADKDQWVAGGKDLIVDSLSGEPRTTPIPGLAMVEIAPVRKQVWAVGSHGAIWEIDADGPALVFQLRDTSIRKARDPDLLMKVGAAEIAGEDGVLALGLRSVFRGPAGEWLALPDDPKVRKSADDLFFFAKQASPPKCQPVSWRSFPGKLREGLVVCSNKDVFVLRERNASPLPRLPKACRDLLQAVDGGAWGISLLCGDESGIWNQKGDAWQRHSVPSKVHKISATNNCLFVASMQKVWRFCEGGAPRPNVQKVAPLPSVEQSRPKAPPARRPTPGCSARFN